MFNLFKSKPTVEFFSLIPSVTKLAPIQPAYNFKPKWFETATKEFVGITKQTNFGTEKLVHTAKCPGIYNLIRYGWVMTTWQDIIIKTNGDGQSFEWRSPVNHNKLEGGKDIGDVVGFHPSHQLADYHEVAWADSLTCVLKINTPWRVIVPKDYYLLEGPLPYSEETRFTTLPGFFSQDHGVSQLNVQLKWHALNGETLIKAGTPIAHYMLVPKNQAGLKVSDATPKQQQAEDVTQAEISRRFVSDRGKSKCVFAKLFGGK
jgi:hypothetical protein